MTYFPKIFSLIFIFQLSIVNCQVSFSQEKKVKQIELLNANSLEYDEALGTKAKRLIGNVALKHDGTTMYCDSAYLFSEENRFDAFGHIHIKPEGTSDLYGDSMRYYGNTKMANIRGKVRLVDKEHTLTTTALDYNVETDLAYYMNGGNILNSNDSSTLTSIFGYFYPKQSEFFFKKRVELIHPDYVVKSDTLKYNSETKIISFLGPTTIKSKDSFIYCENGRHDSQNNISRFGKNAYMENDKQKLKGDSIIYDRNLSIGRVIGNVSVIDTAEDIVINGNLLIHYEKDSFSIVTGKAMLTQFDEADTLYLHADTLLSKYESADTSKKRLMLAFHHVKFYKTDMQGMCDSLVFSDIDSAIKMFRKPVIWSNENQMTADYIEINTWSGKVQSMLFDKNAFIISEAGSAELKDSSAITKPRTSDAQLVNADTGAVDSSVIFNQIKGEKMIGHFDSSKLVMIDVMGKGETVYYAKEDKKTDSDSLSVDSISENNDIIGVNLADCDSMVIHLKDNKVQKISFKGKISAALHPLDQIAYKETLLEGFNWKSKLRPLRKEDIFKK